MNYITEKLIKLKHERSILYMLLYGRGKKAEARFNPKPFINFFGLDSFTFIDYIEFAKFFKKGEVLDLLDIVKDEIIKTQEEMQKIKNIRRKTDLHHINPLKNIDSRHKKWGVMDFETFTEKHVEKPYAWGYKIGDVKEIIIEKENPYDFILETIKKISTFGVDEMVIYLHNFSKFDSYFIMAAALKGDLEIDVIKSATRVMKITLKINNKHIHFLDSFLILPSSLRDLCKTFNVKNPKGHLPYDFIKRETLSYCGDKPSIELYPNIPPEEYDKIPNKLNIEDEINKYLNADLESLYEIIEKFMEHIKNDFNISLTRILTLPQLAFKIWRKKYLSWQEVANISGRLEYEIREGYYGGANEVYRPFKHKAYFYDVNSMYPWSMTQPLPSKFEATIFFNYKDYAEIKDWFFGYLKVRVTCEFNSMYAPQLPLRLGKKLIFPTGTWEGWYFSEELKAAYNTGKYQIKIIMGHKFIKKENLLTDYVKYFYNMKKNANNPVIRKISKLLLNSLYGRLGMRNIDIKTIITKEKLPVDDMLDMDVIEDYGQIYTMSTDQYSTLSNVAIAGAITGYSRVKAFDLIHKYEENILYHDTDSFALSTPIESSELGTELGQLKNVVEDENYTIEDDHKYYIKNAYFIAPKIYKYEKNNGEIIVKIKGLRKENQTPEMIEKMYYNLKITAQTQQFRRIFNSLEIRIEKLEKEITILSDKRQKIYYQKRWLDTKPHHIK